MINNMGGMNQIMDMMKNLGNMESKGELKDI